MCSSFIRFRRALPVIQISVAQLGDVNHSAHLISRIKQGVMTVHQLVKAGHLDKSMVRPALHPRAVWLS